MNNNYRLIVLSFWSVFVSLSNLHFVTTSQHKAEQQKGEMDKKPPGVIITEVLKPRNWSEFMHLHTSKDNDTSTEQQRLQVVSAFCRKPCNL